MKNHSKFLSSNRYSTWLETVEGAFFKVKNQRTVIEDLKNEAAWASQGTSVDF